MIEILTGGRPGDEEIAALVVAILGSTGGAQEPRDEPSTPAWRRAALLESVGGAPVTSAADLLGR